MLGNFLYSQLLFLSLSIISEVGVSLKSITSPIEKFNKDKLKQLEETDKLPETIRGEGGFGSTGK